MQQTLLVLLIIENGLRLYAKNTIYLIRQWGAGNLERQRMRLRPPVSAPSAKSRAGHATSARRSSVLSVTPHAGRSPGTTRIL